MTRYILICIVFIALAPAARAENFDTAAIPRASPYAILTMNRSRWAQKEYAVFRWDTFPSILIFDTEDYAVQDALFKRLAFFTEKKGYRGRLATDTEIRNQHGWNAHDYSAKSLAAFFDLARLRHFPLNNHEIELRDYCAACGIIVPVAATNDTNDTGWAEGAGAVVSISRESPDYLRRTFMVHEGYHGIYFIDDKFREFTRARWDGLDRATRRFLLQFFDYQKYDIKDDYLVRNEFMAHCLQQSVAAAPKYFGETLPARVWKTEWRRNYMSAPDPASVEAGVPQWSALAASMTAEVRAFSDYVHDRWGYAAGRLWE